MSAAGTTSRGWTVAFPATLAGGGAVRGATSAAGTSSCGWTDAFPPSDAGGGADVDAHPAGAAAGVETHPATVTDAAGGLNPADADAATDAWGGALPPSRHGVAVKVAGLNRGGGVSSSRSTTRLRDTG